METIIEHLLAYRTLYIVGLIAVILIILLIILRPKKVKPIKVDNAQKEKSEIDNIIEALENNEERRPMTTFEEEQEANAIISYQELVEAVRAKKEQLNANKNVTVSSVIESLENDKVTNVVDTEVVENNDVTLTVEEIKEENPKKFKNSEFISPIFGKDSNKTNEDFLNNLKDFRSNL